MKNYVAVDIGASSGRVVLGQLHNGKLQLEEIHRFKNQFEYKEGHERWNIDLLIESILVGLEKVKQIGITEVTLGIDTWAVDYCLVGHDGRLLEHPIAYRDQRTNDVFEEFGQYYSLKDIYCKTGIQLQEFNTLFQLYREDFINKQKTKYILLIPDYLGYYLTGQARLEETNVSTTQLYDVKSLSWRQEFIELVGMSPEQFPLIAKAGDVLGKVNIDDFPTFDLPEITVYQVGSHDTASAVTAVPAQSDKWAYISSGTWSLLGTELTEPIISSTSYQSNYTNELGVLGTVRFLKNIMGMWLIQEVCREFEFTYTYEEIKEEAKLIQPFQWMIDVNDPRFINPPSMVKEIQAVCQEQGQRPPETLFELARCIYDNLALSYREELRALETITDKTYETLHIVGGGAHNDLLNQLTADVTGIKVVAGPTEGTAVGNILVQMIAQGELVDLGQARQLVANTFERKVYKPNK